MASRENQENVAPLDKRVKSIVAQITPGMNETKNQVMQLREKGRKTVVERPLLSLAVVFILGLAIGVAIAKSS